MEPIWIVVAAGAVVLVVILVLMLGRRGERVIDMPAPSAAATAEDDPPAQAAMGTADDPVSGALGPGEVLEGRGKDDAECGLADWLMEDVNRTLGMDLSTDPMVITRLVDAALKASADLKTIGRASIELPYLAADASGPKSYKRDITREEVEPGMIHHGALLVDELLQWRGRDQRTVGLAAWLEAEADEESGDDTMDPVSSQRLANATEQAMADIARTGRAVIDLPGMTKLGGGAFHFRREFDREVLAEMLGET